MHDLLDLVELMDAVKPGGILAGGARLAAEAGARRDIALGQILLVENLIAMKTRQRHFARADQHGVVLRDIRLIFPGGK